MEGESNGCKSSYGPMLHSYIWMAYKQKNKMVGMFRKVENSYLPKLLRKYQPKGHLFTSYMDIFFILLYLDFTDHKIKNDLS
jgi:hypothetical protein